MSCWKEAIRAIIISDLYTSNFGKIYLFVDKTTIITEGNTKVSDHF